LAPIFARINAVISYLKGFRVTRKVYICPLASLNDKFFRGSILFQCVFDTKKRDVFAAGGRYDSLIQSFRAKAETSRPVPHAVGFHLPIDRLKTGMSNYLKGSNKAYLKREAELASSWARRKVRENPFF
jgi:translation initiation factor 2-alpha kinase 4